MANSGGGGIGAKFLSVNLNKSYGQQPSHSNHNHSFHSGGSYGQATAHGVGRGRVGGGGGGMVTLSRSRGAQKPAAPKLSVPPPLNLPSLRKEHEKFDVSGSGSGTGGSGTGSGPRPSSSGVGWTKPVAVGSQEKIGSVGDAQVEQGGRSVESETRVGSTYMPPSARPSGIGVGVSASSSARAFPLPVEKAAVLRGEDFPSLQAARPVSSGPGMKQKDNLNKKQKHVLTEELTDHQRDVYHLNSVVDMRPQGQASRQTTRNGTVEDRGDGHGLGNSHNINHHRKEEYFPGPLPLVRLNPRSDWADDERDTGHGFADRGRYFGNSKTEDFWDRDFDLPRANVLPHKPVYKQHERWGSRDDETGKSFSSDVFKLDPYRRDIRIPSREGREGNAWRSSSLHKDGPAQDVPNDRNSLGARETGPIKDVMKGNMYTPPYAGDSSQGCDLSGNQETNYGRRDTGSSHLQEGRPQWNHMESYNKRGNERIARDRYSTDQSSRYRSDHFQNTIMSWPSLSSVGKVAPGTDSGITTGRKKLALTKNERSHVEDPFIDSAGFDERDPFTGGLVGVIKRKKEIVKQTDFHDPVRDSFEAELERVQKIQELERQRIIEEQERALEQALKEEEEKQRQLREEEERRRRLEEEAREAEWRAEQEHLEAIRRAEGQRIAREEEKKMLLMEEERRKQAAYQKLLELEAIIAKRSADSGNMDGPVSSKNMDDKFSAMGKDKNISSSPAELDTWEDSERMVERITSSTSLDSPVSIPYPAREGSSSFIDKGKPFNSWRRDSYENGNRVSSEPLVPEINHFSPRRDSFVNGRAAPRKEFYGGVGYTSSRTHVRGMVPEPYADEFGNQKEQRWNIPGEADSYSRTRDVDSDFQDNTSENYGDVGWGQNRFRGNTRSQFPGRQYPNSEADEIYSYGRSRYSMRQPRVFPPPLITSTQRVSFRGDNERPGPSGFLDNNDHYSHEGRSESTGPTGYFADHQDSLEQSELVNVQREITTAEDQKMNKDMTPRCDSQSSVSVSSPPTSPPHLSHDELDEAILNDNTGQPRVMTASSSISAFEDDEWALHNNNELQEQEEYDEDEDGYQEEDEVREGDAENIDLNHEFEDLHLEGKNSSHIMDNLVLGFDEGVEVEIPSDDSVEGVQGDEQGQGQLDGSLQEATVEESEKTMQDSVAKPICDSYTSITSDNTALSAQQTISTSVDTGLSSGRSSISTVTSAPNQVDVPVKLQFGLFSGPPLIPSPVPAIQIGSFQMPLHLHPSVGHSLTHIHPPQPPMFQFGQLRYASPISQGVLPLPPQSMSFVQSNVQPHYSLNQNAGVSLPAKSTQDSSTHSAMKVANTSIEMNKQQSGFVLPPGDQSRMNPSLGFSSVVVRETTNNIAHTQNSTAVVSGSGSNKNLIPESVAQAEVGGENDAVVKNPLSSSRGRLSESRVQPQQSTGESFSSDRTFSGMKPHGPFSGSKGKRFAYAVKNSSMRSSFPASDSTGPDMNGFQRRSRRMVQRTEFRVRENVERRQQAGSVSYNTLNLDDKSNNNGRSTGNFAKSGSKRGIMSSKPMKQFSNSESLVSGNSGSQDIDSANQVRKVVGKDVSPSQNLSSSGEGNLKRNTSEEDADAPLQSGVVRVFKQPGIEAPSDEDDFIEVRSKRQMLNDKREQRQKEFRAKSQAAKPPRKPRATKSTNSGFSNLRKTYASMGGESSQNHHSDFASSEGPGLAYEDASLVSQPLAPIGTPALKSEVQADKRSKIMPLQPVSLSVVSGGTKEVGPVVIFENKNKAMDDVPTSLTSWDTARVNHQVMALTQTQLEEAMKPPCYDAPIASVGGPSSATSEPLLSSSSILSKERSFSSAASPINSLLAGEKIQFGAVTSPTILPPSNRAPGSSRTEIQIANKLSAAEDDCTLYFDKDKRTDDSCVRMQDSEAEAAASAVAVAAISTDEVIVNDLGSVSNPDTKSFTGADMDGITTGFTGGQQLANPSRAEEFLSVSLPADLSVETPPISLWPPLPSPQSSSGQMLPHFPGGPPSHFPLYEMNQMLGGPIFAFGPHEESAGSQPQKITPTTSSGPLASWQQCQSTVDSFYCPPAGFAGPFINPPGGIPGVQGPPHMVVYNHFAPVGQFGPVGMSFMGPTYIPSGKPPDWKHNTPASAVRMGDGDLNNANIAPAQRNAPSMPSPMPHLTQGSPLMPVASPLAMFDVSPFQSSSDMSLQARWPHVPVSPLHAVSLSRPHQQQAEGVVPSQFGHIHPIDQSMNMNRFSEARISTPSENGTNFAVTSEVNPRQFPNELGLVDPSRSTNAGLPTQTAISESSSATAPADIGKTDNIRSGGGNNSGGYNSCGYKTRSSQQKNVSAHQSNSENYKYQSGGGTSSQRNNTRNEWSHRGMGFHGRNQSFGSERGFSSSKIKQVYVAKQTSGTSTGE